MKALKNIYNVFITFIESGILKSIKFYQKTISPDHGIFKSLHHKLLSENRTRLNDFQV